MDPEGDRSSWLVTFSDLVLQLFAFVIVAVVLEAGSASVEPKTAIAAKRPTFASLPIAPRWPAPERLAVAPATVAEPAERETPTAEEPVAEPMARAPEPDEPLVVEPVVAAPDPIPEARLVSLGRYFEQLLTAGGIDDAAQVRIHDGAVVVSLGETVGFAPGSDRVPSTGASVLAEVASVARDMPELGVQVSGHTDDRPIQTQRFPSNLHLSLARAAQVADHLTRRNPGLRSRVFATGYGAERPVASNTTAEGRAQNRRVEIRLVPLG